MPHRVAIIHLNEESAPLLVDTPVKAVSPRSLLRLSHEGYSILDDLTVWG